MRPTGLERILIGTRGSALALRQTALIVDLLRQQSPGSAFAISTLQTPGDRVIDRPISAIGDKGVFVRPIERALLDGEIDVAVHSLKDVPADVETAGLEFAAFSRRVDPRDALISRGNLSLDDLPAGARIGTSSSRRLVQLVRRRPDVRTASIRGNVDTRLRKLDAGEYDAIVLAAAGLIRLGLEHRIAEYLPLQTFTPDAGQGILAVQVRAHEPIASLVRTLDVPASRVAAVAERAVVRGLGADCHSPVGAYATVDGDRVTLQAMAATEDGSRLYRLEQEDAAHRAATIGDTIGRELLSLLSGES